MRQQLTMEFETLDIIYMESENEHDKNIVNNAIKQDLFKGKLNYTLTKEELKEWFCNKFFSLDLEISCEDLFEIAIENGVVLC